MPIAPAPILYLFAFAIYATSLTFILVGGAKNRDRCHYRNRPAYLEFDDHPYMNSIGIGLAWSIAFFILLLANPKIITDVHHLFAAANFQDPKTLFILGTIFNTVMVYILRRIVRSQIEGDGIDLPKEVVEDLAERRLEEIIESFPEQLPQQEEYIDVKDRHRM